MKTITKEELEANTLDGKDGKDGIVAIAKKLGIDTNGLNRDPMIEAILKVQNAPTSEAKAETPKADEKKAEEKPSKPKTSNKLKDKMQRKAKSVIKKAEKKSEPEFRVIDTKKTDLSSGLPVKGEPVLPMEADEEQQTAAKYSKEDAKIKKYLDKGLAPETVDNFAAAEQIAPIEVGRRKVMFYDETKANRE